MQILKRNFLASVFIGFLIFMIISAVLTSCDVLHEDNPSDGQTGVVINDAIYVSKLGTTYVNLNSLVHGSGSFRFTFSKPKYGTLNESVLGNGIFEYSNTIISENDDQFTLSVFDDKKSLISQKDVRIKPVERVQDLGCNAIIASVDNFVNLGTSGTVTIDLLANDFICDNLKTDIELTITSGPDFGGSIQITSDNKLNYTITPQAAQHKSDQFIYSIKSKSNPSLNSFNAVFLNFDNTCFFSPGGGAYTLPIQEASTFKLSPLSQAILCGNTMNDITVRIINQPVFGTIVVGEDKLFSYTPASLNKGTYTDEITYEVCLNTGQCKKTKVVVKLVSSECSIINRANDKVFDFDVETTLATVIKSQGIDVESNACGRENIVSLEIVTQPTQGEAVVRNNEIPWEANKHYIQYYPNAGMKSDVLEYKICFSDGTCSTAKLYLRDE